jgi:hypothetical protein
MDESRDKSRRARLVSFNHFETEISRLCAGTQRPLYAMVYDCHCGIKLATNFVKVYESRRLKGSAG